MSDQEEIPDGSNFYASLTTTLSKVRVADLYGRRGWSVRECAWDEFEVCCSWADLVIDGESPILLHGPVARVEENAARILGVLREFGVAYSAECYGEDCQLLRKYEWSGSGD